MRIAGGAWVRADWRRRWRAVVGVTLLGALSGAVVLAAATGSRRAASSLDRLTTATNASDVVLDVSGLEATTVAAIGELPHVRAFALLDVMSAVVEAGPPELAVWAAPDEAFGKAVERDRVVHGRRAAPDQPDEVVINERAAALTGFGVGDRLAIVGQDGAGSPPTDGGRRWPVEVVGIMRELGDLDDKGAPALTGTPALWRALGGRDAVAIAYLGVDLADGARPEDFGRAVRALLPDGRELPELSLDMRTKPTRDAVGALATGLAIFAVIAGGATIVVVGLTVMRHVSVTAESQQVLRVLGMSSTDRVAATALSLLPVGLGAGMGAAIGACAASPLASIGVARRAEPDPGPVLDWPVLVFGMVAITVWVLAVGAASAWGLTRPSPRPGRAVRPLMIGGLAREAGAGPVLSNGVRLAFDARPPALPVRSAWCGVTLGLVALAALAIFTASLDRLTSTPQRWGYPWDLSLEVGEADLERAAADALGEPGLAHVGRWDAGFTIVEGDGARAYGLTPLRGSIGFTLVSGRQPTGPAEVVIGPGTADRLDLGVGDNLEVASPDGSAPETLEVVGTAVFPEIDEGNFVHAVGFFGAAFADYAVFPPEAPVVTQVVSRFEPDADRAAIIERLSARHPEARFPTPRPPATIANLDEIRSLPRWLAAFVAALGLSSLVHLLATTLRRRRVELATLRSLGWTDGQVRRCMVWQAVTVVATGLAVALPLGVIAARASWSSVAHRIGVATDIQLPWAELGVAGLAGPVTAAAVAFAVARGHRHRRIAVALRGD